MDKSVTIGLIIGGVLIAAIVGVVTVYLAQNDDGGDDSGGTNTDGGGGGDTGGGDSGGNADLDELNEEVIQLQRDVISNQNAIISNQGEISSTVTLANSAQDDATIALNTALTANSNADLASQAAFDAQVAANAADAKAVAADTKAVAADAKAVAADTKAVSAQSTADTAIINAATAQATADDALANGGGGSPVEPGYMFMGLDADFTMDKTNHPPYVVRAEHRAQSVPSFSGVMDDNLDMVFDETKRAHILRPDAVYKFTISVQSDTTSYFATYQLDDLQAGAQVPNTSRISSFSVNRSSGNTSQGGATILISGDTLTPNSDGYGEVALTAPAQAGTSFNLSATKSNILVEKVRDL